MSDFSFDIEHISVKHMFVSYFLSRLSADNQDQEPIPYLTDTQCLGNESYMSYLCKYNYYNNSGKHTNHSFTLTRSQAKTQRIVLPSLFKTNQPVTSMSNAPHDYHRRSLTTAEAMRPAISSDTSCSDSTTGRKITPWGAT